MQSAGETGGTHGGLTVGIDPLADGHGLLVSDPIERHRVRLYTSPSPGVAPVNTDSLRFPVDEAARFRTESVSLPTVVATYVRDGEGGMLAEVEHFDDVSLGDGSYVVELCAPVKLYLEVDGPMEVASDAVSTRIAFDGPREVRIGARSHHDRPATTVTTTDDPRDLMAAVSTFGSALKTTSPERSYPTLRGHPPLVEVCDERSIPSGLAAPDTGVRIEVPPDLASVYVATPLAYYLGARVVPGSDPRVATDAGVTYDLDGPDGYEREVERVLKRCFLLDCVTRTEGLYQVDLHERSALADRIDLPFAELYDWPLAEQLGAYLDVPYEAVADLVPDWKLTTHVAPTPDRAELLPFVTNDLAVVRTPDGSRLPGSEVQTAAADEFARAGPTDGPRAGPDLDLGAEFGLDAAARAITRGATRDAPDADADADADAEPASEATNASADQPFFRPADDDSLERAWAGAGVPVGASKAMVEAYHNRLNRTPAEGDIGITVVCNDPLMAVERDMVEEAYAAREDLPFEVDVHYALDRDELRETLAVDTEFLHYIGHIDADGFECTDGKLDARTLDTVGPDAFLLNACQSYDQGKALVRGGAVGAIVTLSEVVNSSAVAMGRTLARLLNRGFPLRTALTITREEYAIADQYVVVGEGGYAIAQAESGTLLMCEIDARSDRYDLTMRMYPPTERGMGSIFKPFLRDRSEYYINSGETETFELDEDELSRFLSMESTPIRFDGSMRWSTDVDI